MPEDDRPGSEASAAAAVREARRNNDAKRTVSIERNRIDSAELFVATREITIGHGEETYRLRLTAQNKLLLTK